MTNQKSTSRNLKKPISKSKNSKTTKLATIVSFILISVLAINLLQVFEPSSTMINSSQNISKSNN